MAMNVVDGAVLDAALTATANAIRAKGVSGSLQFDMTTQTGFASAVASIPSGGGGGEVDSGVIFLDYDGTIVESWESADVASKTGLPNNPTHDGLVAQGWNWTLTDIKSHIASFSKAKLYIGQKYNTASRLTEIDVTVTKVTGLLVACRMDGNKNWGDGTTDSAISHTYTNYGDYTITCDGTSIPAGTSSSGGMFGQTSSSVNRYWCTSIRIGEKVTSIGKYAFHRCGSLASVIIPQSVTSIGEYAFNLCDPLTSVTIPQSVTSIGDRAFASCHSLASVAIPQSVTSIGAYMFYQCYPLTSVTIPQSVTSIGEYAFNSDVAIMKYDFTSVTMIPTLANTNAFSSINGICKIIVPDALYSTWIAATNWATYADYIYKASEVTD